jgi:glutathione S-transferase
VLLTLETKKVPYTMEMVDFAAKPQWLVDKWEGKVPVIRAGDVEMADSDKIVEWLEQQYPAPKMAGDVPEACAFVFPPLCPLECRLLSLSPMQKQAQKHTAHYHPPTRTARSRSCPRSAAG